MSTRNVFAADPARWLITWIVTCTMLWVPPAFAQSAGAAGHSHGSDETESALEPPSSAYMDRLKEVMTGEWTGRYTNGTFSEPTEWLPVRVVYATTAAGTAVVENYFTGDGPDVSMTTVYHQDRKDLRLTHYCGAGNHPSMVATRLDPANDEVRFDFTDATNVRNQDEYHSREFQLKIVSDDHLRIQYFGLQAGEVFGQAYDLTRFKSGGEPTRLDSE